MELLVYVLFNRQDVSAFRGVFGTPSGSITFSPAQASLIHVHDVHVPGWLFPRLVGKVLAERSVNVSPVLIIHVHVWLQGEIPAEVILSRAGWLTVGKRLGPALHRPHQRAQGALSVSQSACLNDFSVTDQQLNKGLATMVGC